MDFYSLKRSNHSNVTFGMSHATSIDFNLGSQYNVNEIFWFNRDRLKLDQGPFFRPPPPSPFIWIPRLMIFTLSVGDTPPFPPPSPILLLRPPFYLELESTNEKQCLQTFYKQPLLYGLFT